MLIEEMETSFVDMVIPTAGSAWTLQANPHRVGLILFADTAGITYSFLNSGNTGAKIPVPFGGNSIQLTQKDWGKAVKGAIFFADNGSGAIGYMVECVKAP